MPKFTVMINRTRTIEESAEIEVQAKDEESAQEKAAERISKAEDKGEKALHDAFDWEESSDIADYEYDVSEA